jgi:DNA-binding NtrC family response regulator
MTTKLLVVDQRGLLAGTVDTALRRRFEITSVTVPEEARGARFAVAVVPARTEDAASVCRRIREVDAAHDIVLLGATPSSVEDAIGAIHAGASDFVPRGDDPDAVLSRLAEVTETGELKRDLERLRGGPEASAPESVPFPEIVGESAAMQRLRDRLQRIAASNVTVLIQGESGTGKELVVRALHTHGPDAQGPLIGVSCSAVPRQLMESEFFGYQRGAFTDASGDRSGFLVQASGGTLFLDEIADMPLELQAKLLRALQQRTVRPLGRRDEVPFHARVIVASSKDLEHEVQAGRFRQDLYFRLNVIRVRVPPLRERAGDVLLLAHHFMRRASTAERPVIGITPGAARLLRSHTWPGTVRELEHCILSAVASARHDHITTGDLPATVRGSAHGHEEAELVPLSELERNHILEVLRSVGGNRALASRFLGLDRKTLYRKLKAYQAEGEPRTARVRVDSHP